MSSPAMSSPARDHRARRHTETSRIWRPQYGSGKRVVVDWRKFSKGRNQPPSTFGRVEQTKAFYRHGSSVAAPIPACWIPAGVLQYRETAERQSDAWEVRYTQSTCRLGRIAVPHRTLKIAWIYGPRESTPPGSEMVPLRQCSCKSSARLSTSRTEHYSYRSPATGAVRSRRQEPR